MRHFDTLWNKYHDNYKGIYRYESSITVGGTAIDIKNIIKKNWSGGATLVGFDIGITAAQKFTFTFTSEVPVSTERDQEVIVKVRAVGDIGATPYYSFGTYYSHTVKREGNKYTFECLDCMNRLNADDIDVSGMTMAEATEYFAGIMGCEADVSNIKYDIPEAGEEDGGLVIYSAREILGFIASASGGNFIVDFENVLRLIKLELKAPVETVNTLNSFKTKKNEEAKTLTGIRLIQANGSDDDYIVYESGGGDNVLSLFNPLATQDIADNLFTQLVGYNYTPCEVTNAFINPALEIGDTVIVRGKLTQIWNWGLSQNLTVSFSAPSNYDKYDKYEFKGTLSREISRITKSTQFITEITHVTKEEVVAADNIHASSAFFDDSFVELLETNVKNFICRPVVEKGEDGEYTHTGEYKCNSSSGKRHYRRIYEIYDKYLEADVPEGTSLTADDIEPFKVGGYSQLYFTAIGDSPQAYQYYTFAPPKSKYPDMSDENAALFTVYIKKHLVIREKAGFGFKDITGDGNLDVDLVLGAGTGVGDMGRAHLHKTEQGLTILYTSRNSADIAGTIEIRDDGEVYINGKIPGTGGGHVIADKDDTELPHRSKLQFSGAVKVEDNEESDTTTVTVTGGGGIIADIPDLISEDESNIIKLGSDNKLYAYAQGSGGEIIIGEGNYIILNHTPTQGEIDAYAENTLIFVYDPVGANGKFGKTAYQSALDGGYVGTEQEWVESLHGKTAFQVAAENGYSQPEEVFNETLSNVNNITEFKTLSNTIIDEYDVHLNNAKEDFSVKVDSVFLSRKKCSSWSGIYIADFQHLKCSIFHVLVKNFNQAI